VTPIETTSGTKREIAVEIPSEEVSRETDQLVQKYQKLARIPGFRRGHVPASLIRQRFSQEIQSEVLEALLPRYLQKEAERLGVVPLTRPEITDLEVREGQPLHFKARFEVMPEIKVEGYKELRAEHPRVAVSQEEADEALKRLRESRAAFSAVEDRPLQDGDYAQVSFEGTPQVPAEAAAKPIHVENVLVEIAGPDTTPEFTENLRGTKPGEERSFLVRYAEDFSDERLRAKTFAYRVTINAIKQKTLPELNDEFAKEVAGFETLAELREDLRRRLERDRQTAVEREAKDKLLEELVRRNDFAVPESVVEHQIDLRIERGLRALAAQGIGSEYTKKLDVARLRAEQRATAEEEVKSALLLEKIADVEGIQVGDEEIQREIEALARQTNQTAASIRARLTRDGALDRIRNRIRNEKALEFLYRQSE
jgi:trigger factor